MLNYFFKNLNTLFLTCALAFISIANAQEVRVIDNQGTIKIVNNNQVTTGITAPADPILEGDVWFDTSATPNILKVWDGSSWVSFSQQDTQDLSIDLTGRTISLVNGGNITINPNDADADATNELSDLSISGNILTLSNPATVGNSITLPRSLLSVTTTAAIADVNFDPTNNQVNNSEWISMNTALPTTTINVKTGDIVDVRVHISEDFSRYNDIGDVIRLDVNTPSLINSPTMIETLIAGGDNTFEVASASLNQLFTVTGDGPLTIGIQVKYSDNSPRTYSTNRSGRGGLQVIIYR